LRGAEDADEGGVHDAHGESGDSGSVVSKVPDGIGKVPGRTRPDAGRSGPDYGYAR
jgi:hypothetical protein